MNTVGAQVNKSYGNLETMGQIFTLCAFSMVLSSTSYSWMNFFDVVSQNFRFKVKNSEPYFWRHDGSFFSRRVWGFPGCDRYPFFSSFLYLKPYLSPFNSQVACIMRCSPLACYGDPRIRRFVINGSNSDSYSRRFLIVIRSRKLLSNMTYTVYKELREFLCGDVNYCSFCVVVPNRSGESCGSAIDLR